MEQFSYAVEKRMTINDTWERANDKLWRTVHYAKHGVEDITKLCRKYSHELDGMSPEDVILGFKKYIVKEEFSAQARIGLHYVASELPEPPIDLQGNR